MTRRGSALLILIFILLLLILGILLAPHILIELLRFALRLLEGSPQ